MYERSLLQNFEEEQSDDHDPRRSKRAQMWTRRNFGGRKCGRVAISAGANVDASQFRRRNFGLY